MKIAVTGAGGTVGTAVVALARATGHDVVPIDRAESDGSDPDLVTIDLADYDQLTSAIEGADALVHLAAYPGPGHGQDALVHDNNVVASYHALRSAAEVGITRVCQASSVNAIGGRFSRWPTYDYFPVDERHPTYAEDPYSLSKWICERQADAIVRRFETMTIASLRLHGVVPDVSATRGWVGTTELIAEKQLWGWTSRDATARAFLLALTADFSGHEVFYIVAPETMVDTPSMELRDRHYPEVPVTGDLSGHRGFFDCSKAQNMLGWSHDG